MIQNGYDASLLANFCITTATIVIRPTVGSTLVAGMFTPANAMNVQLVDLPRIPTSLTETRNSGVSLGISGSLLWMLNVQ